MPGRIVFDTSFSGDRAHAVKSRGGPMRILLLGNFSGHKEQDFAGSHSTLASRKIYPVDVDNFDELMSKLSPHLSIMLGDQAESQIELEFKVLDDFHPDALFKHLKLFQSLREIRSKLLNKITFIQAEKEFKQTASSPEIPTASAHANEAEEGLFEQLLGKQKDYPDTQGVACKNGTDQFIQAIVSPHIVSASDPQQQAYLDGIDDAISTQMRHILHNPEFQALESLWRSLHQMITGLETGNELELHMLDLSFPELLADVTKSKNSPQDSALYQMLVAQGIDTPGGEPWSAIVGDYKFGLKEEDLRALATLGFIAASAGGPFLASASSAILGCSSISETPRQDAWLPLNAEMEKRWQDFRMTPYASWIGLVLPRILLRLPYGSNTDEIDSFEFEELPVSPADHGDYLWGSPAYACAMLLAMAFTKNGDAMQPGDMLDLVGLPAFTFKVDQEQQLLACAETYLTEMAGEAILKRGIMPFLSYKNRNSARLLQFRSVASPPTLLNGFWS